MRVFITGATGHIGAAVTAELLEAGHRVVGLARSEESAAALAARGAEAVRGSLDDLDALADVAASVDGVIHLAFKHELMASGDFASAVAADLGAVQTIGAALVGSDKPFVAASGTMLLARANLGRTAVETDTLAAGPRVDAENFVISLAERGVRSSVVRLPPTVHSSLDHHGFVPTLVGIARKTGVAGYVGDGANRWPAVHTLDAAQLFRLALEAAPAGSRLHAIGDEGVAFRDIAEAIGHGVGVPVERIPDDEAADHFDFLGGFVSYDNPTSAERTKEVLGWRPTHPALIADLAEGHYFQR